jgi:hypothetical protein
VRVWLGPLWLGVLDSLGSLLGITISFLLMAVPSSLADPSAELFWSLAAIGATLFVAYSVSLVAVGPRIGDPAHKNWLGSICTLAVGGVSAIAASLALAAFRQAENTGLIDIVGLCWIAANFVLLGLSIALLPAIWASWREPVDDG